MIELTSHGEDEDYPFTKRRPDSYLWARDFPISLQNRRSATDSVFRLEFQLDIEEIADFNAKIKSNLNGNLPIEIKFNKRSKAHIHVPKKDQEELRSPANPVRLRNTSQKEYISTTSQQ